MKLKQVTLITILGVGASLALTLVSFPWGDIVRCPKLMVSFANVGLLHSALLFFLINLYRKG
ncbi:MAG: hypothetical protein WCP12_10370 [bacterium]